MALHFSGGKGDIFDRNASKNTADIKYHLIESDSTIYTCKKWWGDFSITDKMSGIGDYRIGMDDGRMGECIVTVNTDHRDKLPINFNFFGRGKMGGTEK